jgi:hypothetical protein
MSTIQISFIEEFRTDYSKNPPEHKSTGRMIACYCPNYYLNTSNALQQARELVIAVEKEFIPRVEELTGYLINAEKVNSWYIENSDTMKNKTVFFATLPLDRKLCPQRDTIYTVSDWARVGYGRR